MEVPRCEWFLHVVVFFSEGRDMHIISGQKDMYIYIYIFLVPHIYIFIYYFWQCIHTENAFAFFFALRI